MMILLFVFSVFIASISQILLKMGSKNDANLYLNKFTIMGYVILIISTLCTVLAYRSVSLSLGAVLESISYIFVPVLSFVFLKEPIKKNKIIGMLVIILGIIIFYI